MTTVLLWIGLAVGLWLVVLGLFGMLLALLRAAALGDEQLAHLGGLSADEAAGFDAHVASTPNVRDRRADLADKASELRADVAEMHRDIEEFENRGGVW